MVAAWTAVQQVLGRAPARSCGAPSRRPRRPPGPAAAGAGPAATLERREHLLVEAVLAAEVLLDQPQEAARLGPLDDAVVVGGGHRDHLLRADHLADLLQADRVADRAAGDDRALAGHQPGDRGDRAEAARVGERDVRSHEVVGSQPVGAGFLDQRVVGLDESVEGQPPGAEDDRHHQRPRSVCLLDVDRDAEVHAVVPHAVGLVLDLEVVVAHDRHLFGRLRDRVGDQVGEGDPLPGRLELAAAGVEHRHRKRPEARGRRDRQRLAHVAGERRGASPQELGALLARRGRGREASPSRCPSRRRRRRARRTW